MNGRCRRCRIPGLGLFLALLLLLPPALATGGNTPVWVDLDGRPVLEIRVAAGAQSPTELARRVSADLLRMASDPAMDPDQLTVEEQPPYWMVVQRLPDGRTRPTLAVDPRAAASFDLSQQTLAERYRQKMQGAIRQYRNRHRPAAWLWGTSLAALVLGIYVLWLRWQWRLRRALQRRVDQMQPALGIGSLQILGAEHLRSLLRAALSVGHWGMVLLLSYLLIPLLLGLFPPTQVMAAGLRGQILMVLETIGNALLRAVPGLLVIGLILTITAAAVRLCHRWFRAVEQGRVTIPGFYPEWSRPTNRILSLLIVLMGLVAAYPYIPGSGSRAFQGAGLFVGLLAALGSSAVASNVISGVMLIYTRGFREGDRVEINGVIGTVQERALLVTRVRTPRNELVSIPNATVISSPVVNYSFSRREIQLPVALAATVTIGYDAPWRQVHQLLIQAATSVQGIVAEPPPVVLQVALNDSHVSYELNASIDSVDAYRQIFSELLAAIQDQFTAAGIEIMSPHYAAVRNGNPSTLPPSPRA